MNILNNRKSAVVYHVNLIPYLSFPPSFWQKSFWENYEHNGKGGASEYEIEVEPHVLLLLMLFCPCTAKRKEMGKGGLG